MSYRLIIADNCVQSEIIANAKKYLTFSTATGNTSSQFQAQGNRSSNGSGSSQPSGNTSPSDSSVIEIDDTTSNTPIMMNVYVTINNPTVNGSQNGNVSESITLCGNIPTLSAADSGSNANVTAYSQLRIWANRVILF